MTDPAPVGAIDAVLARVHREQWGRVVAGLARRYGDLDLAEEVTAEAFAVAVERWPADGVPPNPGAWITTTAHRKAIDRFRREARRDEKHREAYLLADVTPPEPVGAVADDRLRLLFACCHPILRLEARVALTLRVIGGLTVAEIARAFLVQETTMAQRITRAKAKIAAAGIPFRVPQASDLPERTSAVLAVLYLIFNEGYLASGAETDPIRRELTAEAIRLTRLMHALLPDDGDVTGLLALMLLAESRTAVRVSPDGSLVRLDEQDRSRWDAALIDEGAGLVQGRLDAARDGRGSLGRYELLAAIHREHAVAPRADATDWPRIIALYEGLERIDPSPLVPLNRAIALAAGGAPDAGLAVLDGLDDDLAAHYAFHAARAQLLEALGRHAEARAAYGRAAERAGNAAEREHLARRRDGLGDA